MLHIISVRPGLAQGRLVNEAHRALASGGGVFVVVPKQLTLQTELALIGALEPGGSFRINVLSPERLCGRIFQAAGAPQSVRVDDRGRVMLARRALSACREALRVYSGALHRRGFPARVARQLELLRQAALDENAIAALAEGETGLLRAKLNDLALIMREYSGLVAGRYMDGEAEFSRAAERVERAALEKEGAIIFYGFDVMPRPMQALMAKLAAFGDVTAIFAADPDRRAPDADCFLPVNRSIARLRAECAALGAGVDLDKAPRGGGINAADTDGAGANIYEDISARSGGISSAPAAGTEPAACPAAQGGYTPPRAVAYIAQNAFALRAAPLKDEVEGVAICALSNPRAEAAHVAARCRELAMKGARWNDMLIICGDMASYARPLANAFEACAIPLFTSSSRPASRHGMAEALLSALRLIWKGFRTEDALALLRTGVSGDEAADELSNYMIRYSPRGRALTEPFTRREADEAIESARQRLIEPVLEMRRELREASSLKGQLTALFNYLARTGAREKSLARQDALMRRGMYTPAGEESQVWNRIVSTLDQMAALMGEKRLALEDMIETLRESLDSAVIKPLPQAGDAVYAQGLDQAATRRARYVFIVGMTDRTFSDCDGLLTDAQTSRLSRAAKKYLGPDAAEKALMRRYFIKTALAAAAEGVEFTYPLSAEDGAALRPGALIAEIKRLLPALREGGGAQEELQSALAAPGAARRGIGILMRAEAGRSALAALARRPTPEMERLLRAFDSAHVAEQLRPQTAQRLYGALTSASVTRLELFGRCPFAHFMRYALAPERVEPYVLTPRDEGGFFHDAVRGFIAGSMGAIGEMDVETADARMDEISDALLDGMENSALFDSAVSRAQRRRLRATARAAAEALVNQLAGSDFAPVELEVEFGKDDGAALRLTTHGAPCALEGRVDRIDQWTSPSEEFLRVIDYKRGNTQLRLCEAYYGLQLQLIVYLAAAMRRRGGVGAGVYYFKIDEGIVTDQSTDPDEINARRLSSMKLNGLTISEREVIDAMTDRPGDVINIRINKDGLISRSAPAISRDDFQLVIARTLFAAARHVDSIRAGQAAPSPARTRNLDPCAHCDYRSACLFDESLSAARVRRMEDLKNEEVVERLRNERAAENNDK